VLTGNTGNSFLSGKIRNMNKSVIEAGVDVRNTENELALSDLWTKRDSDLLLGSLPFLWGLHGAIVSDSHTNNF
jgi:hypothetical protein